MKTNKSLSVMLGAVMAVALTAGIYGSALAQQKTNGTSIKISPVLFDQTSNPGEQLNGQVKLSNPGTQAIVLYPSAQNFLADSSSEEGKPQLTTNSTPTGMQDWINFDKTKIELAPGASDSVTFFINVPKNATPGGHYGSLVFGTKSNDGASETTQLKVESAVSALVLLKVSGNMTEEGKVLEFTAQPSAEANKMDMIVRFQNDGNVHVKPTGTITIKNWMGSKVAELPLEGENVLPGSVRKITTSWTHGALFGKYTATLTGTFGTANKAFTAETTFGEFHLTTILIILVVIVMIILFVRMSSKGYKDELSNEIKDEMKK